MYKGYRVVDRFTIKYKELYFLCDQYIIQKKVLFWWWTLRETLGGEVTMALSFKSIKKAKKYINELYRKN
jgi:hypothetical protein